MDSSLPTPPTEDAYRHMPGKKPQTGSKQVKQVHRPAKKTSGHSHPSPPSSEHMSHSMADGRHKRVWKACERCRMKKTKCDGEFPCKRCKDDGLVCTAGTRKKTEYKQIPRGYAEVLEHTQFALIATVHKLYSMVRSSQSWDLGEPQLNDRGQPVIHNIAQKLGCIRANADMDLPVHSVFPEDEAGLAELARQLESQQVDYEGAPNVQQSPSQTTKSDANVRCRSDRASSSEFDHSDHETDYRRQAFRTNSSNSVTLSPQSLNSFHDFDTNSLPATDSFSQNTSPTMDPAYSHWSVQPTSRPASMEYNSQPRAYVPQPNPFPGLDLFDQGLLESEFGTIKPHLLNCSNPEVMMGIGDPMIYSGYNTDSLRM